MRSADRAGATSHMLASLALQMISKDPELIVRFRQACVDADAPFHAEQVTQMVLEMADLGILTVGEQITSGRLHVGEAHEFTLPLPRLQHDVRASAQALAVGSFTTEFVHSHPERLRLFEEWMKREHPSSGMGENCDKQTIENADEVLTLMAHAMDHLADAGVGGPDDEEDAEDQDPQPGDPIRQKPGDREPDPRMFRDDGLRHV